MGRNAFPARVRLLRVAGRLHVGTSGWSYAKWHGDFYPEAMPDRLDLEHYARFFDSVEVNNTFYRLPTEAGLRTWTRRVPAGFRFVVKGSRYVTHRKKLKDAAEHVPLLYDRLPALGDRMGIVLWQLPPNWSWNEERFRQFLAALPREPRFAIEFRDASWVNDAARRLLERHEAAFVIHDHQDLATPEWVTSDLVYVRFHGPAGDYRGGYDEAALAEWRAKCEAWRDDGREVWAFFNNDADGRAPWDALTLAGRPLTRKEVRAMAPEGEGLARFADDRARA